MTNGSNDEEEGREMNNQALPGAHGSFTNKWDLTSKHNAAAKTASTADRSFETSHAILDALRKRRGGEFAQWLNNLESEATSATAGQASAIGEKARKAEEEDTVLSQTIQWLDKMFDRFEIYGFQFNQTAQGSDLLVSCTRPIKRNSNHGYLYGETDASCITYAGHLATRLWSMVLRGCASKVEIFIIPAELLLGFSVHSIDESGYKPLLIIETGQRNGLLIWRVGETVIAVEQLPALAKELFGDLIKVASGQLSESELAANVTANHSSTNPALAVPAQDTALPQSPAAHENIAPVRSVSSDQNTPTTPSQPVAAQSAPPKSAPTLTALTLPSIGAAEQLLATINQDINQLLKSGKIALQSDNNATFEKIKILTERMEALKDALSAALTNVRQAAEQTSANTKTTK